MWLVIGAKCEVAPRHAARPLRRRVLATASDRERPRGRWCPRAADFANGKRDAFGQRGWSCIPDLQHTLSAISSHVPVRREALKAKHLLDRKPPRIPVEWSGCRSGTGRERPRRPRLRELQQEAPELRAEPEEGFPATAGGVPLVVLALRDRREEPRPTPADRERLAFVDVEFADGVPRSGPVRDRRSRWPWELRGIGQYDDGPASSLRHTERVRVEDAVMEHVVPTGHSAELRQRELQGRENRGRAPDEAGDVLEHDRPRRQARSGVEHREEQQPTIVVRTAPPAGGPLARGRERLTGWRSDQSVELTASDSEVPRSDLSREDPSIGVFRHGPSIGAIRTKRYSCLVVQLAAGERAESGGLEPKIEAAETGEEADGAEFCHVRAPRPDCVHPGLACGRRVRARSDDWEVRCGAACGRHVPEPRPRCRAVIARARRTVVTTMAPPLSRTVNRRPR